MQSVASKQLKPHFYTSKLLKPVYNGIPYVIASHRNQINPSDGKSLAEVAMPSADVVDKTISMMERIRYSWSDIPAPKRGEIVGQIRDELKKEKDALARQSFRSKWERF